jgi:hypothetical protein
MTRFNTDPLLLLATALMLALPLEGAATEFHVSPAGNDANPGTPTAPFRTIQHAADAAQPGDTVTVHAGTYRERVNPPRGGSSDALRIVYQAAPGEAVTIKGSELVTGWQFVSNDTWTVTLPQSFFGTFNPFNNLLVGDWFTSNGRNNHSGAVYLNGDWLAEAAAQATVLQPASGTPQWFAQVDGGGYLMNVAWLQPFAGTNAGLRADASWFDQGFGVITSSSSEGGQCVGYIEDGDWTSYNNVVFADGADSLQIRAAAPGAGGRIEVRLGGPAGPLLGTCVVTNTGGWQNWQTFTASITPTSGTNSVCLLYHFPPAATGSTTIWAQFPGKNPNVELVEVNARQSVFYPDQPGCGYITVRGFTLEQAATPWAPPTAEQVGLIGTHWSKGWLIESNTVRYSVCSGVALGKYGDRWDNTATAASDSAAAYVQTIQRALSNGWNRATIGSHTVRGNHIHHCEQAGVVGSLGGAFCTIAGNHIHDIHVRALFDGAELAGIKLHGAIDTQILHNHIHNNYRGIWLDWMAQGTRLSANLFHDSATQDLSLEVDHGPLLVDHNLFLSGFSVWDSSQGEAYAHNLFAGTIYFNPDQLGRSTPFLAAHSTAIAGFTNILGGDSRFYNNILTSAASLAGYNTATLPTPMDGNVFLKGTAPSSAESSPLVLPNFDPALSLSGGAGGYYLQLNCDPAWANSELRPLVTTALLGNAAIPGAPFEQPDGTPWRLDTDFLGAPRNTNNPFPGPFETVLLGTNVWKVAADPNPPPAAAQVMQRVHVDINGGQVAGTAGNFSGTPATVLGAAGETWNFVTPGNKTAGSSTPLLNATGAESTITLAWTANHWSYDNSTAAANYRDLLGDYAYIYNGSGGQSSATWTFSGLAASGTYNLVIYAANGSAGGRWTVNGVTKEASPTASAASLIEGQNYVRFDGVRASASGQLAIAFAIRSGQSYGEMAGLELDTVSLGASQPLSLRQAQFNGGAFAMEAIGLDPATRYVLTRSASALDGFPSVIGTAVSPAGTNVLLSDPAPPQPQAFYRLEMLP